MAPTDPVMSESLLLKGRRFRVLEPGASIRGMKSLPDGAWEHVVHHLHVGRVITCEGLVPGWAGEIGPKTYGWSVPETQGWVEPEFCPSRRTHDWGPMVPWAGQLEAIDEQEESTKLDELVEAALAANGGRLPQNNRPINKASRDLVESVDKKRGQAWLGRILLRPGETHKLVKWTRNLPLDGFAFVLPRHDPEIERLILLRNQVTDPPREEDNLRIRLICQRLRDMGGHPLVWT